MDRRGAVVSFYDPLAPALSLPGKRAQTPEEAAEKADALLLLVGHKEIRALRPEPLIRRMAAPIAVDCQHAWDRAQWQAAGFTFFQLGDRHGRMQAGSTP